MEMILRTQAFKEALDGFHNEAVVCRSINAENFPGRASLLKLQTAISSTADTVRTVYIGNPSGNAAPHSGARTGMRKHDTYSALHYILLASAGPCPGTQLHHVALTLHRSVQIFCNLTICKPLTV